MVFSWAGNSSVNSRFIKSLDSLSEDLIPHAIARFTFEYFENVFMSPDWWDGLSEPDKKAILKRVLSEVHPEMPRTDGCLIDDGLRIIDWSIVSRETNLSL